MTSLMKTIMILLLSFSHGKTQEGLNKCLQYTLWLFDKVSIAISVGITTSKGGMPRKSPYHRKNRGESRPFENANNKITQFDPIHSIN